MDVDSWLDELARLLQDSFPGGKPSVGLDSMGHFLIENGECSLQLTRDLVDEGRQRMPAAVARSLVARGYAGALAKHGTLEVERDLS